MLSGVVVAMMIMSISPPVSPALASAFAGGMTCQVGGGFTLRNKMALGNAGTPPDPSIIRINKAGKRLIRDDIGWQVRPDSGHQNPLISHSQSFFVRGSTPPFQWQH